MEMEKIKIPIWLILFDLFGCLFFYIYIYIQRLLYIIYAKREQENLILEIYLENFWPANF